MSKKNESEEFFLSTAPFSDEDIDELQSLRERQSRQASASLLLYHRDGVKVVSLIEGQDTVIGRCAPSDVAIADRSLSRQHARVTLRGSEIEINDLDSTNGTRIKGVRVQSGLVQPGIELAFGRVMAVFHPVTPTEREQFGLDSHDRFQIELNAEVYRSRNFGRNVTLMMVRSEQTSFSHVCHWFPRVGQLLRPFERCAFYSACILEILLPERTLDQAQKLAQAILATHEGLRCGMALFPQHANSAEELLDIARNAVRQTDAESPLKISEHSISPNETPIDQGPVIESEAMRKVFHTVSRVASSPIPVLILGETGTGKEVVARAIHEMGKRRGKPFFCVNCGAIPTHLVESTLFGHERGAFTGAHQQSKGIFEAADGGTILFDEIGELAPSAQAALLRVLETKTFTRIGSNREIEVDVRIVAATHRHLTKMSESGEFRSDLLFRLDALTLTIPPLRDRPEDLEPLCWRFANQASELNDRPSMTLDKESMQLLCRYHWPGNVRELRNAMDRAVAISEGSVITPDDLPERIRELAPPGVTVTSSKPTMPHNSNASVPAGTEINKASHRNNDPTGLRDRVERFESELILQALRKSDWDRRRAADLLELPLSTLAHKMRSYGIKRISYERHDEK